MKKTLSIILAFLVAAIPAMASHTGPYGSAYNTADFRPYYGYDYKPYYREYFERNDFKRSEKFRDYNKRTYYQQATSPYVIVHSPYGDKPWYKPYGDNSARQQLERMQTGTDRNTAVKTRQVRSPTPTPESYNAFYGFPHYRSYHCHGPRACHYHNILPNSPNH